MGGIKPLVMPNLAGRFVYCLLIATLLKGDSYGQDCNTDSLFRNFRRETEIEHKRYGCTGRDDETDEAYYLLMSISPIDALVAYTNDSIPSVRAQIFVGLAQKNADEMTLKQILDRHITDTAKFSLCSTDVVIGWTVREYMQFMFDHRGDSRLINVDYKARLADIRSRFRIIIPGAHHGIIRRDLFLRVDSLTCSSSGLRIISFELTIRNKTIKTSNVFTKEIKSEIGSLKPSERVFFDEIRAEGSDKKIRNLASISLIVE